MPREWLRTNQSGMSLVEALLAVALFGSMVTIVAGALMFGRTATAVGTNQERAQLLAEEGIEAVRNIRDASFANLTDGTYGIAQSANQWALVANQDVTDIFTRTITISTVSTNRKQVVSSVSWSQGPQGTKQTAAVTQMSNWTATISRSWATPAIEASNDLSGVNDALKVATQGNYAYVVRNDGTPDFAIYDISAATPVLVGSLSLTGAPTNVAVSGNYAYVTSTNDSGELYSINVSNPAAPSLTGTYNAAGTADAKGIAISGNYACIVRSANSSNDEMVVVNISSPASMTRTTGYSLNVSMNEVYIDGADIYIATDSDTQEVVKISTVLLGLISLATSINLPGTTNATTITGVGKYVFVGQGTSLHAIDGGLFTTTAGTLTLPGIINDIDVNPGRTLLFAGTSNASAEFQVVNVTSLTSMALYGSADILTGAQNLNGVAYNATRDRVPGASSSDTQEFLVFMPN